MKTSSATVEFTKISFALNDGRVIRLSIPPLTEERRRQLAKQVHEIAEEHKIAVRSVRHDANDMLKSMAKDILVNSTVADDVFTMDK